MTVKELIAELRTMPQESRVGYIWDGGLGSEVRCVWATRNAEPWVALADGEMEVYRDRDRPITAPSHREEPFWQSPGAGSWRDEP